MPISLELDLSRLVAPPEQGIQAAKQQWRVLRVTSCESGKTDKSPTTRNSQLPTRPSPYWLNEKRLRDQKIAKIGDKISQAVRLKAVSRVCEALAKRTIHA